MDRAVDGGEGQPGPELGPGSSYGVHSWIKGQAPVDDRFLGLRYCNEHVTIYAISSDFGDRMTTQSMELMVF